MEIIQQEGEQLQKGIIVVRVVGACLGEVTNEVGTHIQLGSLQILSFFGASRSSVIGCLCKRSLCGIDR